MQFARDQILNPLTQEGKVLRERKWIILYYAAFKAADSTIQLYEGTRQAKHSGSDALGLTIIHEYYLP